MNFIIQSFASAILGYLGGWLGNYIGFWPSLFIGFTLSVVGWYWAKYWLDKRGY